MSNEIAKTQDRSKLIAVLESSLYPGAQAHSIDLVLGYCEAAGLDPMLKPVHIVPMWDNKAGRLRDVVMPGIGLYRTQASRTGQFAGMSEPEFGPDVSAKIGGAEISYPEWCRVTVRRALPSGIVAEFTAREYWVENYAVKGGKEKSIAPNAMWAKRPRGQIAKCAAAQALRIAFPELGAAPTADEMEGKTLAPEDMGMAQEVVRPSAAPPAVLPPYSEEAFTANLPAWIKVVESGRKTPVDLLAMLNTKATLSEVQRARILALGAKPDEPEVIEQPSAPDKDFAAAYESAEGAQA